VNQKGFQLEPNPFGLYDLTVIEGKKIVRIVRNISFMRAIEIAEEEMQDNERVATAAES